VHHVTGAATYRTKVILVTSLLHVV